MEWMQRMSDKLERRKEEENWEWRREVWRRERKERGQKF
jgi:hypothetical protein